MNRIGHRNGYVEYKYLRLRTLLAAVFISSVRMITTSQAQEKQGLVGRKYSEGPYYDPTPPAYQSYSYYFQSSLYSMGACFAGLDPESESRTEQMEETDDMALLHRGLSGGGYAYGY